MCAQPSRGVPTRGPRTTQVQDVDATPSLVFPEDLLAEKRARPSERELEVRFHHPQYRLDARILHVVKRELVRYFAGSLISQTRETSTVIRYRDDVRSVETEGARRIEYKRELKAYLASAYPYKIAVAEERPARPEELPKGGPLGTTRRERVSYDLGPVRVDCTHARDRDEKDGQERDRYGVELEITDASAVTTELLISQYLDPILRFVLESPLLVTLQTLAYVRAHSPFTYPLSDGSGRTASLVADKPEDLMVRDLSASLADRGQGAGLLSVERYAVTIKADGVRKLLFVSGDSLYLVGVHGRNWSFARVYRKEGVTLPNQGTLIDGELIDEYGREAGEDVSFFDPEARYTYWAFDVLAYPALRVAPSRGREVPSELDVLVVTTDEGTPFMRPEDEEALDGVEGAGRPQTRLEILRSICASLKGPRFSVRAKTFARCDGPERFFAACRDTLDAEYPFDQDGLVFVAMDRPYLSRERDDRGRVRDVSYSRKWKDVRDLTIDLMKRGERLYVRDLEHRLAPFEGSRRFPWDGRFEATLDGVPLEDGVVVEFAYLAPSERVNEGAEEEPGEEAPRRFVPVRYRPDKESPSGAKPAADVWQLLHDPVQRATIRGEGYQLMRRYHNRVKRELLGELSPHTRLLDVGSGQGGDLYTWDDLQLRVTALEPGAEARRRFEERLRALREAKRRAHVPVDERTVRLFPLGGQDPAVAGLGRFDAASVFFAITFFGADEDLDALLGNLSSAVRPGGRVYVTGFDARRFASLLPGYDEALELAEGDSRRVALSYTSPATVFELTSDGEVRLHLSGSLVGTKSRPQIERAIDYEALLSRAEARGLHVDESGLLVEESFLSDDERAYSRATRLLRFTRGADVTVPLPSRDELGLPAPPDVNTFVMTEPGPRGPKGSKGRRVVEEGLLPLLGEIDVDEVVPFEYLSYPLARIGALGDGNCLLHAACRAISDTYVAKDSVERIDFVRELRDEIASDLTRPLFEQLGNGELKNAFGIEDRPGAEIKKVDRFAAYVRFLRSKAWLGDEFLDLFEQVFDVEVIVLWFTQDHGVIPNVAKARARRYPHSIILLNLGNVHYETVGYRHRGEVWTFFAATHPLIVMLRERTTEVEAPTKREHERKTKTGLSRALARTRINEEEEGA